MNTQEMISALDEEISRLRQIRDLLGEAQQAPRRRGRPKGSGKKAISFDPSEFVPLRRSMSPEARERIASAQRERWAAQGSTQGRPGRPAGKLVKPVKAAASKSQRAEKTPEKAPKKRGRPAKKSLVAAKRPVGRPAGLKTSKTEKAPTSTRSRASKVVAKKATPRKPQPVSSPAPTPDVARTAE